MYINVVQTQDGRIIAAFLSRDKAETLADTSPDYVIETVHVQDAQSYPVKG